MRGTIPVRVKSKRVDYQFELKRNITVVRGDSGSGKTTLYEMVGDHMRLGEAGGVSVQCDVPCVTLSDTDWLNQLKRTKSSIVFIDEGFRALASEDFAAAAKKTNNYFVLFTRQDLKQLPYSIDEIYQIKTSGKFHRFVRLYEPHGNHVYSLAGKLEPEHFDTVLTEDAKSGLQFYQARFAKTDTVCESASTDAGIYSWLVSHGNNSVFVIADGSTFGPHADKVLKLQREHPGRIALCLPESFEWLVLSSGLIKDDELSIILDNPASAIESADYFSWEPYFTKLLVQLSDGTPFKYNKGRLAKAYKVSENADKVMVLIANQNIR